MGALTELEKIRRYCENQKELFERSYKDSPDDYYRGAAMAMGAALVFCDVVEKSRVLFRRDDDPVHPLTEMAVHHAQEFIKVRDAQEAP